MDDNGWLSIPTELAPSRRLPSEQLDLVRWHHGCDASGSAARRHVMNEHSRTTLSIVALVCVLGSCESSAMRPPAATGRAVGPRSPAAYETVAAGAHESVTRTGNRAPVG